MSATSTNPIRNVEASEISINHSSATPPPQSADGSASSTQPSATSTSGSTAPSANKFSKVDINKQFKGKSIEPQQKSAVPRASHTGMQTLGKAVANRRMPPPTHLPSLAKLGGTSSSTSSGMSSSGAHSAGLDQQSSGRSILTLKIAQYESQNLDHFIKDKKSKFNLIKWGFVGL